MTVTVKRGAGRPAATARTSRHAQRTPLPPKPEVVETIEEPTGAFCPKERCQRLAEHRGRCGKRTQTEQALLDSTPEPERPESELELPGMWESADFTGGLDEVRPPVEPNKIDNPVQPEVATEPDKPGATKSWGKAVAFRDAMTALGWKATAGHAPDGAEIDLVEVLAVRRTESGGAVGTEEHLYISWKAGSLQHPVTYTINDRTIKMRNASQAKMYAARPVETAEKEFSKVVSNKAFRKKAVEPKRSRLPFDPSLATNEEVITALVGRSVAWHNSISQATESAMLSRDAKRVTIVESDGGERIVKFCCPSTGFRAFRLSALTRVGGPTKVSSSSKEK